MRFRGLVVLALLLGACGQSLSGHVAAQPVSPPAAGKSGGTPMAVSEPSLRPLDADPNGPPGPPATGGAHVTLPVRLQIPSIGVDSAVGRLGLNPDGTIAVPGDFNQAGWYEKGPAPGEPGPAVVLGHLDSYTGPAVFARLGSVRVGSEVLVKRDDGSQVRFIVRRVATFRSDSFPTDEVYGATPGAALRLITCGGQFNLGRGRYSDNVVVFATLTESG